MFISETGRDDLTRRCQLVLDGIGCLLEGDFSRNAVRLDLRAVAGLHVSPAIIQGDPKSVLIEEAKRFQADCIFVGSGGFSSRFERFMLGSVSMAVVNGAHCSVEVVREMDAGR